MAIAYLRVIWIKNNLKINTLLENFQILGLIFCGFIY